MFTSCGQHMVNIDVPAGVGAPPLDKQNLYGDPSLLRLVVRRKYECVDDFHELLGMRHCFSYVTLCHIHSGLLVGTNLS